MKVMVISDTHGHIDEVLKQYRRLDDIEIIIHLGDFKRDAHRIQQSVTADVISVKGNMDGDYQEEAYKIIRIDRYKIFITHGHLERVKSGLIKLYYKALSLSCDIVLFGHTHIPVCIQEKNILMLNPGSLVLPKGGNEASFALLNFNNNTVHSQIIYVHEQNK